MAGRPRLRVSGPAGAVVKMIPGELLNPDGTVSQRSSGGPMWFAYTLSGKGVEEWAPRFTYYGFRYVQVETTAQVESLTGEFIHADAPRVGAFESSSDLFNRIHKLVDMAVRSNLQSVLTDCPHREKLGWLEVAHLMGPSLMFNYDLRTFYPKILHDMEEAQIHTGLVPDIAPEYTVFRGGFRDSPEWGSAAINIPRLLDEWYGDNEAYRRFWPMMTRYADYLDTRARAAFSPTGSAIGTTSAPVRPALRSSPRRASPRAHSTTRTSRRSQPPPASSIVLTRPLNGASAPS